MINAIDYDGPGNLLIVGVPGSGKTTVTIMRAERLSNEGKNVKVFTYQNLLRISLRNIATERLRDNIFGFYDWYYNRFGFFQKTENEEQLLSRMTSEPIVDEILIDEGQDFEARIYRTLLAKCNRMSAGADNAQKVHYHGLTANQIRNEIEKQKGIVSIRLEYNYRNTYEIYNFARHFMPDNERASNPIDLNLVPRGNGEATTIFQVGSHEQTLKRLEVLLQDSGSKNIAILVYHQSEVDFYHAKIGQLGYSCSKHHHNAPAGQELENIVVTTYKSANGLEFQVVIMPDMHTAMNEPEKTAEHYYIGCTRARESLYLLYVGKTLPKCLSTFDKESFKFIDSMVEPSLNAKNEADDLPF